jgi:tRNA threonylcarbamoyladenosine biosynthesis protein TsaE
MSGNGGKIHRRGCRRHLSKSASETRKLGRALAQVLPVPAVVLLRGALGTGKTTLTRGIAEGLGLKDSSLVNSPSFTLVNIYHGRCTIYHVDLYRLSGKRELESVGLDGFMGIEGVTIVEWSERLESVLGATMLVQLEDAGGEKRLITVSRLDSKASRPYVCVSARRTVDPERRTRKKKCS